MTLPSRNEHLVLAGLLALFVCRAVIADASVPPWQGPDEPGHFALAYGLTMPLASQSSIEGAVLQSMVRHRWWDLYEDPPPADLTNFGFVTGIGVGTLAQPLYYSFAAAALTVSRPDDLEEAYGHLRWLSVVLAVATLAVGWAVHRALMGAAERGWRRPLALAFLGITVLAGGLGLADAWSLPQKLRSAYPQAVQWVAERSPGHLTSEAPISASMLSRRSRPPDSSRSGAGCHMPSARRRYTSA